MRHRLTLRSRAPRTPVRVNGQPGPGPSQAVGTPAIRRTGRPSVPASLWTGNPAVRVIGRPAVPASLATAGMRREAATVPAAMSADELRLTDADIDRLLAPR